jgi:acetoin utilization deacetylase AcuC-like enzyme
VLDGELDDGIAFVRPPGHHATADRAMGFCLLNNVAVAAAAARKQGARVAIVDWDVHHGNGTEAIFWDDADVLYVSTHQWPLYPGTGPVGATGGTAARGATVNVPLPAGSGDAAYAAAFRDVVVPSLVRFRPDLILVSAGYDAHRADPLASMKLSDAAYGHFAGALLEAAGGKRVAAVLEGGYDLGALGRSAVATTLALLGDAPAPLDESPLRDVERAAVAAAARAHGTT